MSIFTKVIEKAIGGDIPGAKEATKAMGQTGHVLSDTADKFVTWVEKHGPEAALGMLAGGGLVGGLAGGLLGGGKTKPKPKVRPQDPNYQCGYDKRTGEALEGMEPWAFTARVQIALGVQAVNTDLGDFMALAASSDLTTANQFQFDWHSYELQFYISGNVVAAYVENLAVIAGLKITERDFAQKEEAQYNVADLCSVYSITGLVTSGAAATVAAIDTVAGIPWEVFYKANRGLAYVLRTVKAFTSVGALDFTMVVKGYR